MREKIIRLFARPLKYRAGLTGAIWFITLLAALPAHAGDLAERYILGFSPDGRYFAFEQFGRQDGSGFPYADIFLINTKNDTWVSGSPYRILLKDERAKIKRARREAMSKTGNALHRYMISHPGRLLASNPAAELSANPYEVRVNARFAIPSVREPWVFRLEEHAIALPRCRDLLGKDAKGFSLLVTPFGASSRELHYDHTIPESRGCPLRYAISDVILHEPDGAPRVFVILISVYSFGFEGPDRRFIAVTASAGSVNP